MVKGQHSRSRYSRHVDSGRALLGVVGDAVPESQIRGVLDIRVFRGGLADQLDKTGVEGSSRFQCGVDGFVDLLRGRFVREIR